MVCGKSFLTAATFSVFVAACGDVTVRPGDVKHPMLVAGGTGIQGTFEIAFTDDPNEESTLSGTSITGGACLVVQDTRYPIACETYKECKAGRFDASGNWHTPGEEAYGYCLPSTNSARPKTCWTKLSKAYCIRGKDVGLGIHETPTVTEGDAHNWFGAGSKLSWRVLGCVNGIDLDAVPPGPCGEDEDKLHGWRVERSGKESS